MLTTARLYLNPMRHEPGELTEGELVGRVSQQARCAVSRVEPDQWFPVAMDVTKARDQAADAIAVCAACPVRAYCLEFAPVPAPQVAGWYHRRRIPAGSAGPRSAGRRLGPRSVMTSAHPRSGAGQRTARAPAGQAAYPPPGGQPRRAPPAWKALARHASELRAVTLGELFDRDPDRGRDLTVETCGLYADFAKHHLTRDTVRLLAELACECGVQRGRSRIRRRHPRPRPGRDAVRRGLQELAHQ